jgi:hypothetical protein
VYQFQLLFGGNLASWGYKYVRFAGPPWRALWV